MPPPLQEIAASTRELYQQTIQPLERRFSYEPGPDESEISGGPLVLLIGNHSSGKSTFINYVLGEEIQATGMAPTDDRFTVLRFGEQKQTRDGEAVVSNPDLPYAGLRRFGPRFLTHLQLRSIPNPILKELSLVDTPGMIDSPQEAGRGYDFAGVVAWFARRADLVLLFFDPDRPGTTAETLRILTECLDQMGHKVLVVMNKMDQFRSMRDFARCYGALCWNLGKVIHRKDIPQIYTMYIPTPGAPDAVLPLDDFDKARAELEDEIRHAPFRRVENLLTHTSHHAEDLRMHARIVDRAKREYRRFRTRSWLLVLDVLLLGAAVTAFFLAQNNPDYAIIAGIATGILALTSALFARTILRRKERAILTRLDDFFEEVYRRELVISDRPESLVDRWSHVKPVTQRIVGNLGLRHFPKLRKKELRQLDACLEQRFPKLRADLHRPEAAEVRG